MAEDSEDDDVGYRGEPNNIYDEAYLLNYI
jgi:hypothetical protein